MEITSYLNHIHFSDIRFICGKRKLRFISLNCQKKFKSIILEISSIFLFREVEIFLKLHINLHIHSYFNRY